MNETVINDFIMLIIILNAYELNLNMILELKTTSNIKKYTLKFHVMMVNHINLQKK